MRTKSLPFLAVYLGVSFLRQQPSIAQQPEPAAVVTIVTHATVGAGPASEGSTIFSGDLIKTGSDGRLQLRSGSAQFGLEPDSSLRIFKTGGRVLIELEEGTVTYSTSRNSETVVLFAQDIRFVPRAAGESASGRITIVSPCSVNATALRGSLDATSGLENKTINAGTGFSVLPENAVQYNPSWKPQLSEYPDYPRQADYHHSHTHTSCAAKDSKNRKVPGGAGHPGHFEQLVEIAIGVATIPPLVKALESSDKP